MEKILVCLSKSNDLIIVNAVLGLFSVVTYSICGFDLVVIRENMFCNILLFSLFFLPKILHK